MYEYKYVKIKLRIAFLTSKMKQDRHEIIDQHAREGWRFVQAFAPAISGYGSAPYVELIFERVKNKDF